MANLPLAPACVSVFVALILHGCGNGGSNETVAPGTCEGTFKTSEGADIMVTYNPAEGRMGTKYTCPKDCMWVSKVPHEFNCTGGIKMRPEGEDTWQDSPTDIMAGACECADGKTVLAPGACEGSFKSSKGADVMVTYNPAEGRMGVKYTCDSTAGCEFYFVENQHHDFNCTGGKIQVKPDGTDDWQNSPAGKLEGACDCATGETARLFSVGGGFLQHLPIKKQSWNPAAYLVAAVAASSVVATLAVAVSRRVRTGGAVAPFIQSSAE